LSSGRRAAILPSNRPRIRKVPQVPDSLILHGTMSSNVAKVVYMLEECGLHYATRHVAVFAQEQFTPEFQALNPLGKVPVLEDSRLGRNGRLGSLAESGAILLWLAEREGRFLPASQPERAEVMQWLMFQMANYGPLIGQLNHFGFVLKPGTHPYAEGRYRAIAERLYRVLDDHLARHEWLAGGAYSIADMAMQPRAENLERFGFDPASHPALVEWRARIAARPAIGRARQRIAADFAPPSSSSRRGASDDDLDRMFGRTAAVPKADFSPIREM
jgi:GST-like protein